MTVPVCFPDGWRVWFGTAICWGFDASDPRLSSLKEAMLSTDIIFTNTCCDVKKRKCESVRTSYWIHSNLLETLEYAKLRGVTLSNDLTWSTLIVL